MPGDELPSGLHEFIARNIRSVEQLEILLLVARDRDTAWTVQSVYDVILSTKPSVERWLDEFVRLEFLTKEGAETAVFRFVATEETALLVRDLGHLYKTKPVRVIEAIFKADRNPAQSFADSFRFKPKE
jgi:hypothetical protein